MPYFDHFRRLQPTVLGERVVRLENEQMLRDMVRLQEAGESILEIGPGRGAFAVLCREEGFRYTAVEANEAMAADLEKKTTFLARVFVIGRRP
jgi:16S rRNA A1518/A1519 N6-dimethyltransferase RsmA/KsgA/DIM1 with predicted DNA glycosylase/AP lyase activity